MPLTKKATKTHAQEKPKTETTALVPKKESTALAPISNEIPFHVRNNPVALKLWENATDEERTAGSILSEFQSKTTRSAFSAYFDLAERWNDTFPRSNKKLYARGEEAVKIGAKLAGISQSTVYSILRTTRFYGRQGYEALSKKAEANGVVLYWTHLRIIVERLSDNKEARTQIERLLVTSQLTESQLNKAIDELVPSGLTGKAIGHESEESGGAERQSSVRAFAAHVLAFKNVAKDKDKLIKALEGTDDEFNGDVEQGKVILTQVKSLISCFEELQDFFDANLKYIMRVHDTLLPFIEGQGEEQAMQNEKAASGIKKQISVEKKEEQQRRASRLASQSVAGDVADSDSGDTDDEDNHSRNPEDIFNELGDLIDG